MDTGSKHGKRFVCQQNENLKRMDTGTKKNKRFVFQHSESLKTMDTGKQGIDTAEKKQTLCLKVRWEVSDTEHQQKKASRVCFQQGEILKKLALIWKTTSVSFSNTVRIWREWTRVHTNGKRVVFQEGQSLERMDTGTNGKRDVFQKGERLNKSRHCWKMASVLSFTKVRDWKTNTGNKWRAFCVSTS